MSRYLSLTWGDLTYEAQQSAIETIKESLLENAETEGKEFLAREWHDPKPKTWQEAYVRTMAIKHIFWDDYENQEAYLKNHWNKKEDIEIPTEQNWVDWLDEWAEDEAENRLSKAIKYVEWEVEV